MFTMSYLNTSILLNTALLYPKVTQTYLKPVLHSKVKRYCIGFTVSPRCSIIPIKTLNLAFHFLIYMFLGCQRYRSIMSKLINKMSCLHLLGKATMEEAIGTTAMTIEKKY